jgi:DNA-directed RNA polymerase specialized sigma24 family protein
MSTDEWDIAGALEATEGNWDPAEEWEWKAQRLRDQQLVDRLSCRGFTGPEYATFAAEFAAYGLAVCRAWLASGIIFSFCARRGRPLGRPPDFWTSDDRHELVLETVALALKEFRERALVRKLWSPDGGASLKTYFIGTCLFVFPNVFRTWQRGEARWSQIELADAPPDLEAATHDDPASIVPLRVDMTDELRSLDPRTAAVIILTAERYTQQEIAEILGMTVRAVEGVLNRHRRRQVKRSTGGDSNDARNR